VFIEGTYFEGKTETDIYMVFAEQEMAEQCVEIVENNKAKRKFASMWVDKVYFNEYPVHEEAKMSVIR
jgi:glutamate synthase domain-containing protein 1